MLIEIVVSAGQRDIGHIRIEYVKLILYKRDIANALIDDEAG